MKVISVGENQTLKGEGSIKAENSLIKLILFLELE